MSPRKNIYLDNNATTPVDPKVYEAMTPYLNEQFGNPSSQTYSYGWEAQEALETARKKLSKLINCETHQLTFTSGATESNNLALIGLSKHLIKSQKPLHIISSSIEHKSVLLVLEHLESLGVEVSYVSPTSYGQVSLKEIKKHLKPHTQILSFMWANNEVGSLNPIFQISKWARENELFLHVDAAQAVGKIQINLKETPIDLLSLSGHKFYGPKGVGALYINSENKNLKLEPIMFGGSQENALRPGTQNVPGIVGLGKAAEICFQECQNNENYIKLRDYFLEEILKIAPNTQLNGHPFERLPSHLSLTFKEVMPFELTSHLMGVAYSSTSACSSACSGVSYVLKNIGLSDEEARATLRFGLGRFTEKEDLDIILQKFRALYLNRKLQPVNTSENFKEHLI